MCRTAIIPCCCIYDVGSHKPNDHRVLVFYRVVVGCGKEIETLFLERRCSQFRLWTGNYESYSSRQDHLTINNNNNGTQSHLCYSLARHPNLPGLAYRCCMRRGKLTFMKSSARLMAHCTPHNAHVISVFVRNI